MSLVKYLYAHRKSLAGPEVERFKVLVLSAIALASLGFWSMVSISIFRNGV